MAAAAIPMVAAGVNSLLGWLTNRGAGRRLDAAGRDASGAILDTAAGSSRANEAAATRAISGVEGAATNANEILGGALNPQLSRLDPYQNAGAAGANSLQTYLQGPQRPDFGFNPQDLENEPGYQFLLREGTNAVNNSASARGLLQSGNTLRDLTEFNQGLAGTTYQQAFNRALSTFNANRDTDIARAEIAGRAANTGLDSSRIANQAIQNTTNQQANNVMGAAEYSGNTGINLAQFLAGQNANAANRAAGYRVEGAGGRAAGDIGAANSVGAGVTQGANSLLSYLRRPAATPAMAPASGPNNQSLASYFGQFIR